MNKSDQVQIVVCVRLITVRNVAASQTETITGETLAPIVTMLHTRVAKGEANLLLAQQLHCGGKLCTLGSLAIDPDLYAAYIDAKRLGLPLGWYFSRLSLEKVFSRSEFSAGAIEALLGRNRARAEENSNLYSRILHDLKGSSHGKS